MLAGPRTLAWLLLRRPSDLDEREQVLLKQLYERSPELVCARQLAQHFLRLVRERRGRELDDWVAGVHATGPPELRGFSRNLQHDWAAVHAGLTERWSSGSVEGNVNKVKVAKRQMFGRARFDFTAQTRAAGQLSANAQPCASARGRVIHGRLAVRSIGGVNEATSTGENEQRRAARKRYQAQYRALYDQLLEILFQLDPIGAHQDNAEKFVPELATILPRLRDARTADDVEQIVLEDLRRWYGRRRLANLDPERLTDATIAICSAWNHFLDVSAS
jgi:hypothetical protein